MSEPSSAVSDAVRGLSKDHQSRLVWFADRAGRTVVWADLGADGLRRVSAPKGIYKPEGLEYALSIRLNLDSDYADGVIRTRQNGSWFFSYHQEGPDPDLRDSRYTNKALMACLRDRVPVGVLRERAVPERAPSEYDVLGLAYPVAWREGYFFFESVEGPLGPRGDTPSEVFVSDAEASTGGADTAPPGNDYDARRRVYQEIVRRRGQPRFRQELLAAYNYACAVTGCQAVEVLEAAHLRPYRGPASNVVSNGLLLRGDLHTLLDLQLLAVEPGSRRVRVSRSLGHTEYAELNGRLLFEPSTHSARPDATVLEELWDAYQQAEILRVGGDSEGVVNEEQKSWRQQRGVAEA